MKRFFKYLVVSLIAIALWSVMAFLGTLNGWWYEPFTESNDPQLFAATVNQKVEKAFVGNFAMALMKGGVVEKEVFFSQNKKVDKNTIFQVSSLSKFVSTIGVLKLVEMGEIDLDAPVNNYLKRWKLPPSEFDNNLVTARRLLSHTAGLTDGLGYNGFENRDAIQTIEASLTKAEDTDAGTSGKVKVGIEPNSKWVYSGGGFTLLQLLIEETSEQSFNDFMVKNVFQPLKMNSSTYILKDSQNDVLCEFYNADGTPAPHFYYTSLAATSLYTTLSDLESFFQIFFEGKNGEPIGRGQISPESIKLMRSSQWDIMGERIYGLGTMLYIGLENGEDIFGHDGKSTPPINTAIRIHPNTGDGIIILETGHPDIATTIASDWVFLETGKIDTLLFTMSMSKISTTILVGSILIVILSMIIGIWRTKRSSARNTI